MTPLQLVRQGVGLTVRRARRVDVDGIVALVGEWAEAGLLVLTAGEHTLRLLPPLVVSSADVARGLALLEQAIAAGAPAEGLA